MALIEGAGERLLEVEPVAPVRCDAVGGADDTGVCDSSGDAVGDRDTAALEEDEGVGGGDGDGRGTEAEGRDETEARREETGEAVPRGVTVPVLVTEVLPVLLRDPKDAEGSREPAA